MASLIVPIYSMRDHESGLYSLLKDGNLQLHLSRMSKDDYLAVPTNTSDYFNFLSLGLVDASKIVRLVYGSNAYDTRKNFWKYNALNVNYMCEAYNLGLVTDITGFKGEVKTLSYNFNITSYPELDRPYIDEFLEIDVKSVNSSNKTTVLNYRQKEVLVENGADPSKIEINTKVLKPELIDILSEGDPIFDYKEKYKNYIFFPFRISDKAYNFEQVVNKHRDHWIIITDPNNSYDGNYPNVVKIEINKNEYYRILKAKPTIVYNENPELVLHPGLAELIYFDCNILCNYRLPKLENLM